MCIYRRRFPRILGKCSENNLGFRGAKARKGRENSTRERQRLCRMSDEVIDQRDLSLPSTPTSPGPDTFDLLITVTCVLVKVDYPVLYLRLDHALNHELSEQSRQQYVRHRKPAARCQTKRRRGSKRAYKRKGMPPSTVFSFFAMVRPPRIVSFVFASVECSRILHASFESVTHPLQGRILHR